MPLLPSHLNLEDPQHRNPAGRLGLDPFLLELLFDRLVICMTVREDAKPKVCRACGASSKRTIHEGLRDWGLNMYKTKPKENRGKNRHTPHVHHFIFLSYYNASYISLTGESRKVSKKTHELVPNIFGGK